MNQNQTHDVQIDHHTSRLIVGLIAIFLALLVEALADGPALTSISESYHKGGAARDVFVGSLFAIAAFLFAYNGHYRPSALLPSLESWLSKLAALSALGIALVPCKCYEDCVKSGSWIHYLSAVVLFVILAYFCWGFYRSALRKSTYQAKIRARIYQACTIGILSAIGLLFIHNLLGSSVNVEGEAPSSIVYWLEALGLVSFGVAWMVASRILPVVTGSGERIPLFSW